MNPLIKKEIRLLLPAWCAATALVVLLPWVLPADEVSMGFFPVIVFIAGIVLAVDVFGREFSLGTFQSFMAQPMERREWWRVKMRRLIVGTAALFLCFCATNLIRLWTSARTQYFEQAHINALFAMFTSGVLLLVGVAGGLWTSLVFRQVSIAFWVSLVLPPLMVTLLMLVIPEGLAANTYLMAGLLVVLGLIYSYAGFKLAYRLFMRAQDVAWTGGVINLSRWQYFERSRPAGESHRRYRPLAASFKKELQLQSVSFICAAVLLVLHLAVLLMRWVHGTFYVNSIAGVISESYWALWLVMPFLLGGTAIAEERKLNVTDGQFCLPLARHRQFALKFLMTMVLGVILGGWMPCLIEYGSAVLGLANGAFSFHSGRGDSLREGLVVFSWLSAGLTLLSIFASSLARQFLQALGLSFVSGIGCVFYLLFLRKIGGGYPTMDSDFGGYHNPDALRLWSTPLAMMMAVPSIVLTFIWLAWRNFKQYLEYQRRVVWSVVGLAGVMILIMVVSTAVFHRFWEYLGPRESAHGAAQFTQAEAPVFLGASSYENLLPVLLPDGRVRVQAVSEHKFVRTGWWRWLGVFDSVSTMGGPSQYLPGSNWVSMVVRSIRLKWSGEAGFVSTYGVVGNVGIKSDGTLWFSNMVRQNRPGVDEFTRFGSDTDWKEVAAVGYGQLPVVLLKKNGTLWYWDGMTNAPYRLDDSTDWCGVITRDVVFAQKNDGTVWGLKLERRPVDKDRFVYRMSVGRDTNFTGIRLSSLTSYANGWLNPYLMEDGSLWQMSMHSFIGKHLEAKPLAISHQTNWVSVVEARDSVVALRADGTLWKWNHAPPGWMTAESFGTPVRVSQHKDWVALTTVCDNDNGGERYAVSLAADGSLWLWPHNDTVMPRNDRWLAPPKRPVYLGNVLKVSE